VVSPDIKIADAVQDPGLERYLYRCLAPMPFRRYKKRAEYLKNAAGRGLRKEVLLVGGDAVGMIEYAPAPVSAYPISGKGISVMNCIWVLRRAKGHGFGKLLMRRMLDSVPNSTVIATIALVGHPSPWLKLPQIEYLGFRSIDSRRMRHKVKRPEICFETHLMWMPLVEGSDPPEMDWDTMMRGVDFCIAHPLYRAERLGLEVVFEEC